MIRSMNVLAFKVSGMYLKWLLLQDFSQLKEFVTSQPLNHRIKKAKCWIS